MIAALAAAMSISACGSSTPSTHSTTTSLTPKAVLDMHTIVRSIEAGVFTQRHIHATVTCPPVIPQQKGRNFACLATAHGSRTKTPVAVTQQNNDGYVTYRVDGASKLTRGRTGMRGGRASGAARAPFLQRPATISIQSSGRPQSRAACCGLTSSSSLDGPSSA